jgi:hypothetical protein
MGALLKPRVVTKAQAEARLNSDTAAAKARYDRRIAEIEARASQTPFGSFDALPSRAKFALKDCLMSKGPPNNFGRPTWVDYEGEITPEVASKIPASQILRVPNAGHNTVNAIAAWLEFHGYELQP